MNNRIYKRIIKEANYAINDNMTIRQIAKHMNISKSTVHKDLHERLCEINKKMYYTVDNIMKKHIKVRHINGGNATKKKYEKLRKG